MRISCHDKGKGNQTVVSTISGIVDPRVVWCQRAHRQSRGRRHDAVFPIEPEDERISPRRSCAIPFSLVCSDPSSADGRRCGSARPSQPTGAVFEVAVRGLRCLDRTHAPL